MNERSISVTKGNPSEQEAAAIAAAIDLYAAELNSVVAQSSGNGEANNWQRAALREAVEARRVVANVWGSAPVGPS
jgi:hypothetical protein